MNPRIVLPLFLLLSFDAVADTNNELRLKAETARMAQVQLQKKCDVAKELLALDVGSYKKTCAKDSDCKAAYVLGDSCEAPAIISKDVDIEHNTGLKQQQDKVREACAALWQNRPPCSPIPVIPVCVKGVCLDKNSIPAPVPPPLELNTDFFKRPFSQGTIEASCAPHDGPALAIRISPEKFACGSDQFKGSPDIRLSLWDGKFVSEVKAGSETSVGHGSVCKGASCEMMESFRVKVLEFEQGKRMKAKFEGKTYKGFLIPAQTFEVFWCHVERLICG